MNENNIEMFGKIIFQPSLHLARYKWPWDAFLQLVYKTTQTSENPCFVDDHEMTQKRNMVCWDIIPAIFFFFYFSKLLGNVRGPRVQQKINSLIREFAIVTP